MNSPFKEGVYRHAGGFIISVSDTGIVLISPDHPLSMRLSEFFDASKWERVEEGVE